ncbi:MAG: ABC transporter substrate-binding protein [bacterium]
MLRKLMVILLLGGAICLLGVASAMAEKYNEAPMLSELVKAGKLPPVEKRLPEEPLVVKPFEQIGKYGGTIRSGAFGPKSGGLDCELLRAQNILQIEPDLKTIGPNIAKRWDIAKDFKSITIYLRKGMKWSDGAPFTADDFLFWYEDIALNAELTPTKSVVWQPGGEMLKMMKVDDYTVRLEFAAPYPAIDEVLARSYWNGNFFQPKHYLKKWHIKYNPKANELAKEEGYDSWWQCFQFHMAYAQDWQDVNLPSIAPWTLKSIDVSGNKYFERNPYYWKVDTAGNQLPYIDRQVRVLCKNAEVRVLKLISGELHNAGENPLPLKDYTLYKENEAKGDYTLMLFENTRGSDCSFSFNLTHKDPVLRKIFNDLRFRQAMSLAINRQEINDVLYFGKATIRQATAPPMTSFYEEWMGKHYTEYNPEKANALLDEMGLKWDKDKKVRLRPDGQPLRVVLECTEEFAPMSEFVAEHWTRVGVQTTLKQEERMFFYERGPANERDAQAWTFDGASEFNMRSGGGRLRPAWGSPIDAAPLWQAWFDSKGKSGEEPPAVVKESYEAMNAFNIASPGTEEYMKLGKKILTLHAENLWIIGMSVAPRVIMISNSLGNTPKEGTFAVDFMFWIPYKGDQWFFKK